MGFTKLGTERPKLMEHHTEIYPTMRAEKISRVVRITQIDQKLGKKADEKMSGLLRRIAYCTQAETG